MSTDAPRRHTLTDAYNDAQELLRNQHEERMAAINKPSRGIGPTYSLKRSTSSGSLGVVAIDVDVPVCELFPTAEAAVEHLVTTFDTLTARYPMPDGYVRAK
jgi:hypothetical protein